MLHPQNSHGLYAASKEGLTVAAAKEQLPYPVYEDGEAGPQNMLLDFVRKKSLQRVAFLCPHKKVTTSDGFIPPSAKHPCGHYTLFTFRGGRGTRKPNGDAWFHYGLGGRNAMRYLHFTRAVGHSATCPYAPS